MSRHQLFLFWLMSLLPGWEVAHVVIALTAMALPPVYDDTMEVFLTLQPSGTIAVMLLHHCWGVWSAPCREHCLLQILSKLFLCFADVAIRTTPRVQEDANEGSFFWLWRRHCLEFYSIKAEPQPLAMSFLDLFYPIICTLRTWSFSLLTSLCILYPITG